jgi:hypothetical protein
MSLNTVIGFSASILITQGNCITTKHYDKGDEAIFSKPTDFNKSSQSAKSPKSLGLVRRKSATLVLETFAQRGCLIGNNLP